MHNDSRLSLNVARGLLYIFRGNQVEVEASSFARSDVAGTLTRADLVKVDSSNEADEPGSLILDVAITHEVWGSWSLRLIANPETAGFTCQEDGSMHFSLSSGDVMIKPVYLAARA